MAATRILRQGDVQQSVLTLGTKFPNVLVVKTPALLVVTSLMSCFSGCNNNSDGGEMSNATVQAEAMKIFIERCATCHGPNGAGDGPAGVNLNPKPRNLQDATWQSSVDDAYVEKIIKLGGLGVGKSAAMPPNPDIADNERVVKALVIKVRSLKR